MPKPTPLTRKPTTLITKGLEPHGARLRPPKKPMDFLGVGTAMLIAKGHGSTSPSGGLRIFELPPKIKQLTADGETPTLSTF
jgi:hypothetical protein